MAKKNYSTSKPDGTVNAAGGWQKSGQTLSLKGGNGKPPVAKPQGKPSGKSDIRGGPYDSNDSSSKEGNDPKGKPGSSDIVGGPYKD